MIDIIVTNRTKAGRLLMSNSFGPTITHIVSIGTWEHDQRPPAGFLRHGAKKIRLKFHDVTWDREGLVSPKKEDVERLVSFYKDALSLDKEHKFLIHCWAGQSRSTAAALILLLLYFNDVEKAVFDLFTRVAPWASPNRKMVALIDEVEKDGLIQKTIDEVKERLSQNRR